MIDDKHTLGSSGMASPSIKINVEPITLTLEAIELAKSGKEESHRKLRAQLVDEEYILSLNTEDQYFRMPPEYLQLHFIMEALLKNTSAWGVGTIDLLASSPLYQDSGSRKSLLISTSGKMSSAPLGIQVFWKNNIHPDSADLDASISALVSNGSTEAIAIFENTLRENEYEEDYVVAWLQESVLTHRQDFALLEASERLFGAESWASDLKVVLIEVLFEYRPEFWYGIMENEPPRPPQRDDMSDDVREILLRIANLAEEKGYMDKERFSGIKGELSTSGGPH